MLTIRLRTIPSVQVILDTTILKAGDTDILDTDTDTGSDLMLPTAAQPYPAIHQLIASYSCSDTLVDLLSLLVMDDYRRP